MRDIFVVLIWLCGVVLAKGFWSTLGAVVIPFWAFYLVVEQLVTVWLL